jgi:transglutaminase-like putative cysteine protease
VSIHVALNHVTEYHYDRRVGLSPQVVRLRPAPHSRTPILSYSLRVEPAGISSTGSRIPSNYLARLVFPEKTEQFSIEVDLVAEMAVINPFDFFLEPAAEKFPFSLRSRKSLHENWRHTGPRAAGRGCASVAADDRPRRSSARSTSWSN